MLLWIVLAAFLLPLIYLIVNIKKNKEEHSRQLETIQKKIADKERQAASKIYAVIFKAEINEPDESYAVIAARLRELAINEFGCLRFTSCTEGCSEIAISYWPSKEKIQAWKDNSEHKQAQELGKTKWYKSYEVQVVEVLSQYGSNLNE